MAIVLFSMLQPHVATAAGAVPPLMASAAVINRTHELDGNLSDKYFNVPGSIQTPGSIDIALRNGVFSRSAMQALKSASSLMRPCSSRL